MNSVGKIAILVIGCFLWLVGTSSLCSAAPKVIKVSLVQPENDIFVKTMKDVFKPFVEEKTNGQYKVEIFSGGSLGNCDTVFQGVQLGTLQIAMDAASNLAQFIPELSVLDMPYMFPTLESIKKAYNSPVGKEISALFQKKRLTEFGIIPSSFRTIATTIPVTKLEDVANLKLRTTSSKSHMLSVESLGMAPTPMPVSEMLTGLQQGVVKGLDPDLNFLVGAGFVDVAKHIFLSDHSPVCYILYCSSNWLKKQPEDVQKIIHEAASLYETKLLEREKEYTEHVLKDIVANRGATVVRPSQEEKQRWIDKSASAYEALDDKLKPYALGLRSAAHNN